MVKQCYWMVGAFTGSPDVSPTRCWFGDGCVQGFIWELEQLWVVANALPLPELEAPSTASVSLIPFQPLASSFLSRPQCDPRICAQSINCRVCLCHMDTKTRVTPTAGGTPCGSAVLASRVWPDKLDTSSWSYSIPSHAPSSRVFHSWCTPLAPWQCTNITGMSNNQLTPALLVCERWDTPPAPNDDGSPLN